MQEQPQDNQPAKSAPAGSIDDPRKLRAGYFENIGLTAAHIGDAVRSEGKRLRNTDYFSIVALPVFSLILAIFATNMMLTPYRPFGVLAFFLALMYFIGARIGVIRALSARQAHLIFNIMLATFMLGCTFALLIFEVLRSLP
ncbi:MAG: hypothetical protein ACRD3W_28460 [Terriglobales bacterium]